MLLKILPNRSTWDKPHNIQDKRIYILRFVSFLMLLQKSEIFPFSKIKKHSSGISFFWINLTFQK